MDTTDRRYTRTGTPTPVRRPRLSRTLDQFIIEIDQQPKGTRYASLRAGKYLAERAAGIPRMTFDDRRAT
jgi:hypothetical protein